MPLTAPRYTEAGVNIDRGDDFVESIRSLARSTARPGVIAGIGGYASLFRLPRGRFRDPVLVASTDGVGTKIRLARELGRVEGIGQDLVAMCANDLICVGAEPLFFLDYYASGHLDLGEARRVVKGITRALKSIRCALVGGETAEMPGVYPPGEFDLAGFAVGAVDRKKMILGKTIRPGDIVLGLASSGPHSNGYSLIRRIVDSNSVDLSLRPDGFKESLADALTRPTRLYVNSVLKVCRRYPIKGLAHITGGGLVGNIPRILPPRAKAILKEREFPKKPIFDWLATTGSISPKEMYRVFNCGIGFVVVAPASSALRIQNAFDKEGEETFLIGEIGQRGRGESQIDII